MQLCIENVDQAGGCAYGYACVYTDTISWAGPSEPLPMVRDPRAAFDQLFGVGATPAERAANRRTDRSILDWVTARSVAHLQGARPGGSTSPRSVPDRDPRDRAPHPARRVVQRERRAARSARRADGRARLVQRAREADVRPAGDRVRGRHHARVLVQARTRRLGARLPGERRAAAVPPGVAPRRERAARAAVRADQQVPRRPGAVLPRQAEEHPGRGRATCSTRRW